MLQRSETKKQAAFRGKVFLSMIMLTLIIMMGAGFFAVAFPKDMYGKKWIKRFTRESPITDAVTIAYNNVMVRFLGTSPSEGVVLGKEGWLFFSEADPTTSIKSSHLRERPFSKRELFNHAMRLKKVTDNLKQFGISFYLIIAPDKQTIYPEYLPDHFGPVAKKTRRTQFMNYLAVRYPELNDVVMDLTPKMRGHKNDGQLYFKTDTHWSYLGAFVAYKLIAERLIKDNIIKKTEMVQSPGFFNFQYTGDIATFALKLGDKMSENIQAGVPTLCYEGYREGKPFAFEWAIGSVMTTNCPDAPERRIILLEDSFMRYNLWNYLSYHFSEATHHHRRISRTPLWKKGTPPPRVVIVETAERFLPVALKELERIRAP